MKIALAFVADYAVWQDDRRVSVVGGGMDSMWFSRFPAGLPELSLVLKVLFLPSECGQEHTLQIRALNADDRQFFPMYGLVLRPTIDPSRPSAPSSVEVVYRMRDISFPNPGRYRFSIELERLEVASVDLLAEESRHVPLVGTPSVETIGSRLHTGFLSYSTGKIDEAVLAFRRLTEQFPHSPDAHNNLGFTLLTQGDAQKALESFVRAQEEGYLYSEFLEANLACCYFLMGRTVEAYEIFPTLMRQSLRSAGGLLLALGRTHAQPLPLLSPGDYIALMALNAGRSGLAAGRKEEARTYAQIAQAGRVTYPLGPSADTFNAKLVELMEDTT